MKMTLLAEGFGNFLPASVGVAVTGKNMLLLAVEFMQLFRPPSRTSGLAERSPHFTAGLPGGSARASRPDLIHCNYGLSL